MTAEAFIEAANIAAAINEYVNEQYRTNGIPNPYLVTKENTMAVTTNTVAAAPFKPTATKEVVKVQKQFTTDEGRYTLTLSEHQAGYLIDLLEAHVAGEIARYLTPLSAALRVAGAYRMYAKNTNKKADVYGNWVNRHAVVDFADDYSREIAGVPTKNAASPLPF